MYLSKNNGRALFQLYQSKALLYDIGDFIEESGVPLHYLDAYFNAECDKIELEHRIGLARALDMTVAELDMFMIDNY